MTPEEYVACNPHTHRLPSVDSASDSSEDESQEVFTNVGFAIGIGLQEGDMDFQEYHHPNFDGMNSISNLISSIESIAESPLAQTQGILAASSQTVFPTWEDLLSKQKNLGLKTPGWEHVYPNCSEINIGKLKFSYNLRTYLLSEASNIVRMKFLQAEPWGLLGNPPQGAKRSPIFTAHYNLLQVYGSQFAQKMIEMLAMTSMSGQKSHLEKWRTGSAIYFGSSILDDSPLIGPAKLARPFPEGPSSPEESRQFWQLRNHEVADFFGADRTFLPREKSFYILKGWDNPGNHTGEGGLIACAPPRSASGKTLDSTLNRVQHLLYASSLSSRLLPIVRQLDVLCESVGALFKFTPHRDIVLPILYQWYATRTELIRHLENFEILTLRNRSRLFPEPHTHLH